MGGERGEELIVIQAVEFTLLIGILRAALYQPQREVMSLNS